MYVWRCSRLQLSTTVVSLACVLFYRKYALEITVRNRNGIVTVIDIVIVLVTAIVIVIQTVFSNTYLVASTRAVKNDYTS